VACHPQGEVTRDVGPPRVISQEKESTVRQLCVDQRRVGAQLREQVRYLARQPAEVHEREELLAILDYRLRDFGAKCHGQSCAGFEESRVTPVSQRQRNTPIAVRKQGW
jgi:hypothetical protein